MNKTYKPGMAGGAVRIFSKYQPCVNAGDEITVEVAQQVGDQIKGDDALAVHLIAEGPHERLAETDIVGRYPAPGTSSSPDEFLPHIGLSRRSLPWERLRTKADLNSTPWLALLVFKQSELGQGGPKSTRVDSLKAQHPAFYQKLKGLKYGDDTQLDLVWIAEALLKQVLPRPEELPLLCHVQRLDTPSGDESDPMWKLDDDATVAIVIANRLPDATGAGKPEEHLACLVSLEGRDDLQQLALADRESYAFPQHLVHVAAAATASRAAPAATASAVRAAPVRAAAVRAAPVTAAAVTGGTGLGDHIEVDVDPHVFQIKQQPLVVLHSWRFTPSASGDFEQVVKAIRYAPNGGVLRFGQLPSTPAHPTPTTLTADGYLVLSAPAEPTGNAYYRGPLTPTEVGRKPTIAVRAAPTELQDPAHPEKLDDYSYATAFELGRLLTLADDGLLSDLQSVRRAMVPPLIKEVLAVDPRPVAIAKKDWVVNPNPEAAVILPQVRTDFTGIAQYKAQVDLPQLATDLGGIAGAPEIEHGIDIEHVSVPELDAAFSQLVTHTLSGKAQP